MPVRQDRGRRMMSAAMSIRLSPGISRMPASPEHLLAVEPQVVDVVVGGDTVEQALAQGDQEVGDGQRHQVGPPAGRRQAEARRPVPICIAVSFARMWMIP